MYDGTLRMFARMLKDTAFKQLSRGIVYTHDEVQTLVCEAIPNISKTIPVFQTTQDLPTAIESEPYMLIQTTAKEYGQNSIQSIEVKTELVYGDPIIATLSMVP